MGLLRGLGLNETRCVVGPRKGGVVERSKCVNLLAVPPAIWTYLEFWYLGRRPGICILGVQREGAWRAENGNAGGQRAERRKEEEERGGRVGGKNGLSFSLSVSPPRSLTPSLCMCSAAPAVCLPTHSLRVTQAGGSRDTSVTPAQPGTSAELSQPEGDRTLV